MTTIIPSQSEAALMSSAEKIGYNEDIIMQILDRVPIKCAFRCNLVSKYWNSFISNPRFRLLCHLRSRETCKRVSHLFVLSQDDSTVISTYDIFPIFELGKGSGASFSKFLNYVGDGQIKILQSCNGLICFRNYRKQDAREFGKLEYYVGNPTTRQYKKLPDPIHGEIGVLDGFEYEYPFINLNASEWAHSLHLAFDPRKSPYFKVVCVYLSDSVNEELVIEIYSSETGKWKRIMDSFSNSTQVDFSTGVYWNGAINWLSDLCERKGLYFKIDEESFGIIPDIRDRPDVPNTIYFGESDDHLFHIENYVGYGYETKFNIFEMDKEYSGWSLRYTVDMEVVAKAFPKGYSFPEYKILSVVHGDTGEDLYVVLLIHGKAIRYNLETKCFKKIWNFGETYSDFDSDGRLVYRSLRESFQYTESLCTL